MVQRRTAGYVTNRYHNTSSVSSMIEQLEWTTLQERRRMDYLTGTKKNGLPYRNEENIVDY
jgi:hypothetical protein